LDNILSFKNKICKELNYQMLVTSGSGLSLDRNVWLTKHHVCSMCQKVTHYICFYIFRLTAAFRRKKEFVNRMLIVLQKNAVLVSTGKDSYSLTQLPVYADHCDTRATLATCLRHSIHQITICTWIIARVQMDLNVEERLWISWIHQTSYIMIQNAYQNKFNCICWCFLLWYNADRLKYSCIIDLFVSLPKAI
jgi:hypothetical protein